MRKQAFLFGVMFGLGLVFLLGAADYKKFQHRDADNRRVTYFDNMESNWYTNTDGTDQDYDITFKGHRLLYTGMCNTTAAQAHTIILDYEDGTRDTIYPFLMDVDHGYLTVDLYTSRAIDSLFIEQGSGAIFWWLVQGNE